MLRFTFPITKKSAVADDGRLEIGGVFSTSELDKGGDIVPLEVTKAAVSRWDAKNLREMHDETRAIGKALTFSFDEEKGEARFEGFVSAAEKGVQTKVLDGTLSYFSIAAPKANFSTEFVKLADGKRARKITSYDLAEISLVDNPMNAAAKLEFAKAVGIEDEPVPESRFAAALLKAVAPAEVLPEVATGDAVSAALVAVPPEPAPVVLTAEQASSLGISLADGETLTVTRTPAPVVVVPVVEAEPAPAPVEKSVKPDALAKRASFADAFRKCCDSYAYVPTCWICKCACGAADVACDHSCCCGDAADMGLAISCLVSLEALYAREMEEQAEGESETGSMTALTAAITGVKAFLVAEATELMGEPLDDAMKAERVAFVKRFASIGAGIGMRKVAPSAPALSDEDVNRIALALSKSVGLTAEDGNAFGLGLKAVETSLSKAVAEVGGNVRAIGERVEKIAGTPVGYIPGRNAVALEKTFGGTPELKSKIEELNDKLSRATNSREAADLNQQIALARARASA